MGRELTCKELVELVTGYLDGSVRGRRRRRFEAHLAGCDGCTRYLRQMEATIRVTGSLTEAQVTEEQKAVLL
ncbi:MAG TPA: zf-HC2 domain-containing protein, partial [Actinomycetota bacterium]|nr:zf-HC2 domain-containing protein [Actinomycetota bacterium]